MNPQLRYTLFASLACVIAAIAGWQIAEGSILSFDFMGLVAGAALVLALGAICVRLLRLPLDVILFGFVLVGYLVANRGFAQLTPTSGLPLFPAELALMVALVWRSVWWAYGNGVPVRRDALNYAILIWIVAGSLRLPFDVPRHGFTALRDYAMVYYALFFFVVQHMAADAGARRYLLRCLLAGVVILPVTHTLSLIAPDFFLNTLVFRGVPLIYFKGDLALTFLAVGSLLIFFNAHARQRLWAWPVATALFIYVISGGNRASMLGLVVGAGLLVLAKRWKYAAIQFTAAGLAGLLVFALAVSGTSVWADKKIENISDRVRSLVDVRGTSTYQSEDSSNKGDNNQFRLVWWKSVFEETASENPVFGLGFGHDLAHGFVQEYYVDSSEEFSTRSPHNIFLSVFGRMGVTGLLVWLAVCVFLWRETWRSFRRDGDYTGWALWSSAWVILVSATFGVVLEGPMGAVIFWTLIGLGKALAFDHTVQGETAEPADRTRGEIDQASTARHSDRALS